MQQLFYWLTQIQLFALVNKAPKLVVIDDCVGGFQCSARHA